MELSRKKLLILGANQETALLVKTAQEMGIYVIVTDFSPNSYAKQIADKSYNVDGMDVDKLVELAQMENVDGVLVGIADPLIPSYYKVCQKLGVPCYVTEKAVDTFTNKKKFKKCCEKFGIHGVPEYTIEDIREDKIVKYPIMIKPSDGRSGKGMSVCYSIDEVNNAINKAMSESRCKDFLIERYMECDDTFMYYTFSNGKYLLSAMPDRFTSREQRGVDPVVLGGIYPSKYINTYMDVLHEKMCTMFKYLDIRNGVFLVQAFIEDGQFYVYDPGFRLQGAAPDILIERINGISHQKMLIDFALTGKMVVSENQNDYYFKGNIAASQVVLLKKGLIKRIVGIEEISEYKEVVSVTQRLFEGDEVTLLGTEQQILVRFHIICNSKERLQFIINKINNIVMAFDEEGNNMCLNGLQSEWV